ncbi:MAG: heparinase II/III family protein [Thiobacillus sp.]|nr:heparinase II/III family protein [Thiobacillus sp.]
MRKYVFPLAPGLIEYIFAPFYDHEHSSSLPIEIDGSTTAAATRENDWCYTKIVWHGGRENDIAVSARCLAPFDAVNHDQLVAAFTLPQTAMIEFALIADNGSILGNWSKAVAGTGVRQEVFLSVDQLLASIRSPRALARLLRLRHRSFGGVAFRISSATSESGVLALTWLGLRDSKAYKALRLSRAHSAPDWSPWILERSDWGEITPQHGLLFGRDELLQIRAKKGLPGWKEHFAFLEGKAQQYLKRVPEDDLGEYLPHHDLRYMRAQETPTRAWHWEALILAFVGLVNDDERMIGHALRYLMCMIHTQHWVDSAENRIPSSSWNWRSFMEEMTTTSVAILLDWLGFALSSQASSLARQALWTRGIAHVQRDLFQFDYMHTMNQGAVFCRALILGGLALEQGWPRASHVADDAYRTMKTVLGNYIKSDGGISEGPGYLCQTLTATLWSIIAYSRARGLDWRVEVRELFGSVESYVRAMATGKPGQCIPSGDCRLEWFSGDGIPILASVFPDSAYSDILMECLSNGWVHEITGTLKGSGGMVGMAYGPEEVKPSRNIHTQSLWLPVTGKFSRTKEAQGRHIRLWATVSIYGASHSHLDHGGFGIEIDEYPVFVDRGMAEYWNADLVHQMRRSFAHNVLTPVMADGSWADQSILTTPSFAPASAIEAPVLLRVPSQDVWPEQMAAYERVFEERRGTGQVFLVRDIGELCATGRVAFHLHSPHSFVAHGNTVTAEIAGTQCTVTFPWAKEVTVKKSIPDFAGRDIFHIYAVSDDLTAFELETAIAIDSLDSHTSFRAN